LVAWCLNEAGYAMNLELLEIRNPWTPDWNAMQEAATVATTILGVRADDTLTAIASRNNRTVEKPEIVNQGRTESTLKTYSSITTPGIRSRSASM
jgi:hypothetical protein